MKKRVLSLLLSLMLLVGLLPAGMLTAAAAESSLSATSEDTADVPAAVGAQVDAATGAYDYTDPGNPYVATTFAGLQEVFNKERSGGKTVYIKLGKNISCTSTEDSDARLISKGSDIELDLSGYTLSCTDQYDGEFILGRNGNVVIRDSQRYDSSKEQWVSGKIDYFFDPIDGNYPVSTTILTGDVTVYSGVFVNRTRASDNSSVYRGNALKLYDGIFDSDYPIFLTEGTAAYGIYGGLLRMKKNSKTAITIDLTKAANASTAKLPTVKDCVILNDSGKTMATAIGIIFSEDFADGLTHDKAKAVFERLFPSGTVLYQDGYKMASVTSGFRYTIGTDTCYSSAFESEYRIVTPATINSISLTIPEPKANETITYQSAVPTGAAYALDSAYGDSSYWSRGVCWTRVGYIGPMNCHVPFDFLQGKSYKVEIAVKSNDERYYPFADTPTATVNGGAATVTDKGDGTYIVSREFLIPTTLNSFVLYVTEPKEGQQAKYTASAPGGAHYQVNTSAADTGWKNGVLWCRDNEELQNNPTPTFQGGSDYTVFIMIVPKNTDEYLFADAADCTATVNGKTAQVMRISDNKYAVSYTYTLPKTIDKVAVTIAAPQSGAAPAYHASVPSGKGYKVEDYNTEIYQNGVAWYHLDGTEMTSGEIFKVGQRYTVTVSLVPSSDKYEFATSGLSGTVNGANAVTGAYNSSTAKKNIYVEYTFAVTEKTVIESVYLTIPDPIAGTYITWTASAPEGAAYKVEKYTGGFWSNGVQWHRGTSIVVSPNLQLTFEKGNTYSVSIRFTPKDTENYQFAEPDKMTAKVNGSSATVTRTAAGAYYATYKFTATDIVPIHSVALTIDEPKAGEQRPYTAALTGEGCMIEDYYSVVWDHGVTWQEEGYPMDVSNTQPFKPGRKYTVIISLVLTNEEKYQFAALDCFTATVNGKQARVTDYADNNYGVEYTFTVPDASYILGDADCDGTVTILDATCIQRHLVSLPVTAFDEKAADADQDDSVTILDATAIQRYLVSLPTNPNIGKMM